MQNLTNLTKQLFITTIVIVNFFCLSCNNNKTATIYRDTWGIPHIYADQEEDLAFVFGYAQAEDRLHQLLSSYRYAEGTLAEAFGEEYVAMDYSQRMWRHAAISREKFSELPADLQKIITHFTAGIKQYMKDHPDKVPDWAPEIHPWHVVAWGRTFIWDWPLGQALDDLQRGIRKTEPPHNSNQWVISAAISAEAAPIALVDPHLNFETTGHWYEARLHAGELHVCGMSVVGTPFIALGHNQYIAWSATTGGPDCADVYALDINPQNPAQYNYDGQWRPITSEKVIIRAKNDNGFSQHERTIERCHYGPIKRPGLKAYAIKCAYENEILLAGQMRSINKAKNLNDFKQALAMCQLMPQNMMFAGIDGNIYYARTGRVPIRPEGYDWNYPVPGNTSKSEWLGLHPHEDLVQLENPACGYMQNCNISPGTMMPNSPLTSDRYPGYIYNDSQDHSNPRGRSALRLLGNEQQMTLERAKQIALDTSVDGFENWQTALQAAFARNANQFRDLRDGVALILGWNGHLDADNTAAALYRFWRRHCDRIEFAVNNDGTVSITKSEQNKMLVALRQAQDYLVEKFGKYQISWGATVRLTRGDKTWPVSGGSFKNGVNVLRAAWGNLNSDTGITTVTGGQSCCMVVLLKQPVQSFSILPWGESDDPRSPHFRDQAENLFSQSKFKSTFFTREELMNNLTSQKYIVIPEL